MRCEYMEVMDKEVRERMNELMKDSTNKSLIESIYGY